MVALLLLSGWFYWFQYRPSQIRQQCSWIHRHSNAVQGHPAYTEEELKQNGSWEDCSKKDGGDKLLCDLINKGHMTEQPKQSEKDWQEKASSQQYTFCIHSKGL